ncbi:hypothetical protein KF947_20660 [Halomonas sp. FeN2]|mgnify:FL=1|uniref:hypothetical protein n=1 Tax=Halomonas sp. FeN2 TaxID=2832500 RepID=UPI001D0B74B0|nr:MULTISPECIES: hypothetical protein [unclassified Halomonas]UBR49701.1 hypothetical protein KF947_20660 [Halomonas sp. FeN2]
MKYIITLILISFSQSTMADNTLRFSDYTSNLRVIEIDNTQSVVRFSGEVEVSGTIVFRLDMLSETEYGEPLFVDFIPAPNQTSLFPEVISGFYAGSLKQISLLNTDELYTRLFGSESEHKSRELRIAGTLRLNSFSTRVECDSRQYSANLVSFSQNESMSAINRQPIYGC